MSTKTESTAARVPSIEDLHVLLNSEDWNALAEFATRRLSGNAGTHRAIDADAINDLMLSLVDPPKASKLWSMVLKTCMTTDAVESYLRKKAQRDSNRVKTPKVVLSFRSRVRRVLRLNASGRFCCDYQSASRSPPLYGLARWNSSLADRGSFCGTWNDGSVCCEVQPHAPAQGKTKSERIENGCSILLDVVEAYASPKTLARGLENCALLRAADILKGETALTEKDAADLKQDEYSSSIADKKELWSEFNGLLDRLDERQEEVARLYTFPKWIASKHSLTLHQVGTQLGVSHQTVDNQHKKVVVATKAFLTELGFDDDLTEWSIFLEFLEELVEMRGG